MDRAVGVLGIAVAGGRAGILGVGRWGRRGRAKAWKECLPRSFAEMLQLQLKGGSDAVA